MQQFLVGEHASFRWTISIPQTSTRNGIDGVLSVSSVDTEVVKETSRHNALLDCVRRKPFSKARSELVPWFGRDTLMEPINVHINIVWPSINQVGDARLSKSFYEIFNVTSIG